MITRMSLKTRVFTIGLCCFLIANSFTLSVFAHLTPESLYIDTKAQQFYEDLNSRLQTNTELQTLLEVQSSSSNIASALDDVTPIIRAAKNTVVTIAVETLSLGFDKLEKASQDRVRDLVLQQINLTRPTIENLSVNDRTAYLLFLESPGVNKILGDHNDVRQLKARVQASVNGAQSNETADALTFLRHGQFQSAKALANIDTNQILFKRGQDRFQAILETNTESLRSIGSNTEDTVRKLELLGVTVDHDFKQVLQGNAEIKKEVDQIYDYLKAQNQRQIDLENKEQQRANIQGVMDSFGFLGALGQHLGNNSLHQVAIAGQSLTQIQSSLNLISSVKSAFTLADLSNFTSIGNAVLQIAKVFGKRHQGPSESEILRRAIQSVSTQLHEMRTEMHDRFDRVEKILGQMHKTQVLEFAEMRIRSYRVEKMLENIERKMNTGFQEVKGILGTLNNRLYSVENNQIIGERQRALTQIYEIANTVNGPFALSSEDFKKVFTELKTLCDTTHCNRFLVGEAGSIANVVKNFETDQSKAVDFNIASLKDFLEKTSLYQQTDAVNNPLIYAWTTAALMLLLEQRYEKITHPEKLISRAELSEVKKVLESGKSLKKFQTALQNPEIFNSLSRSYKAAMQEFATEYAQFLNEEEKQLSSEAELAWNTQYEKRIQPIISRFKSESISVDPYAIPLAFKNCVKNFHKAFKAFPNGCQEYYYGPREGVGPIHAQEYKRQREWEINYIKDNIIAAMRAPFNLAAQNLGSAKPIQIHLNKPSQVSTSFFEDLIEYEGPPGYPILPKPIGFNPNIPDSIRELEALGQGHFKLEYGFEGPQLVIKPYYYLNNSKILLPVFKTYFPYERAQIDGSIMYSIFKGPEAMWRFWVGGTYADGTMGFEQLVKEFQTPETNIWRNWCHIPTAKPHPGRREDWNQFVQQGVVAPHELDLVTKELANLKTQKLKKILLKLRQTVTQNEDAPISKALLKLSYYFYMLKAQSSLANRAAFQANQTPHFFSIQAPRAENQAPSHLIRNREDLLTLIDADPSALHSLSMHTGQAHPFMKPDAKSILDSTQTYFEEFAMPQVRGLLSPQQESPSRDRDIFDTILSRFSESVEWYQNHSLNENELSRSASVENRLTEENRMFRQVFNALGPAIMTVTSPAQQTEIYELLSKTLRNQGVVENTVRQLLLPASLSLP